MGTAIEHLKKPVLGVAGEDIRVSRLVLGIDAPNFEFHRYRDFGDIPALVDDFLTRHLG